MRFLTLIMLVSFLASCSSDSFPKKYVNQELTSYDSKVFVWRDNGTPEEINLSEVSFSNQLNSQYFNEIFLEDLRGGASIIEEFVLEDESSFSMVQTQEGDLIDTSGRYTESAAGINFDLFPDVNFKSNPDKDAYELCIQLIVYASGIEIPVLDTRICEAESFEDILEDRNAFFNYKENDTIVVYKPTIEYLRTN